MSEKVDRLGSAVESLEDFKNLMGQEIRALIFFNQDSRNQILELKKEVEGLKDNVDLLNKLNNFNLEHRE